MAFRSVAVDLEFIKCGGEILTRSIALVPFTRGTDRRTVLPPTAQVLSLAPEVVMRQCDVLPCGALLEPFLLQSTLNRTSSPVQLEEALAPHKASATEQWEMYRKLKRDLKEAKQLLHQQPPPASEEEEDTTPMSPEETRVKRELQIRLSITTSFSAIDPYGIPNVTHLEERPLRQLYSAAVGSAEFEEAVLHVRGLRAYGKGKGSRKSLAFLLRYHPEVAQTLLRHSFPSEADWIAWLTECATRCRSELQRVSHRHRELGASLQYTEVDTLPSLSHVMNRSWAALLHGERNTRKFYCYGNNDQAVLGRSLTTSCREGATTGGGADRHRRAERPAALPPSGAAGRSHQSSTLHRFWAERGAEGAPAESRAGEGRPAGPHRSGAPRGGGPSRPAVGRPGAGVRGRGHRHSIGSVLSSRVHSSHHTHYILLFLFIFLMKYWKQMYRHTTVTSRTSLSSG
ncbi:hypothetical protein AGDE_11944 [Angomonas deanei]|uniref:Uncharacterized protein n=1 Tax=Angomonas deanei TaxID=59799 RepID=A0A7G2C810_9TRYP|nr:hypothetical protein AGDE_11944 [Angomonas deanei]CAD2215980.1 hypothetical protein, conserved [Angomonas deanei]|eukprot:EPY25252.1 hypothetical protein AGDE_11944 [Angomonas deanei]